MASQFWKQFGSSNSEKVLLVLAYVVFGQQTAYLAAGIAGDISRDPKRPFRNVRQRLSNQVFRPVIDDVPAEIPQSRWVQSDIGLNWSRVLSHRRDEPDLYEDLVKVMNTIPPN